MRFFSRRSGANRRPTGSHHRPSGGGDQRPSGGGDHQPVGGDPATGPARSGVYRSRSYAPLRSWQVRGRRFRTVGPLRRGLDPADVQSFLDRVADDLTDLYDDLTDLYDELNESREETSRIKEALRCWQSQFAPRLNERAYR